MRTWLLAAAFGMTGVARASDVGEAVTYFGTPVSGEFLVDPGPARLHVFFETAASDYLNEPFDAVLFQGVSPDKGVAFEAARRLSNGVWGPWRTATTKRFPGGRFWAKATFPEGAAIGGVRLRALNQGVSSPHRVEIFSVEAFASGDREAAPPPPGPAPRAHEAVVPPPVHERGEWGAAPPKEAYVPHALDRYTQHHSGGRDTTDLQDSLREVRFIQDFHMNGRGWNDIAYHFLIDGAGRIFRGRPEGVVGAHTKDNNTGNIGICALGNYHPPKNDALSRAQLDAICDLGVYLRGRYGISPDTLKGHRDYRPTDCPGDGIYSKLAELREAIRSRVLRPLGWASRQRLSGQLSSDLFSTAPPAWISAPRGAAFDGSKADTSAAR